MSLFMKANTCQSYSNAIFSFFSISEEWIRDKGANVEHEFYIHVKQ